MKAIVKRYTPRTKYGFITTEQGDDIFFHANNIPSDYYDPRPGDEVEYKDHVFRGKPQAIITSVLKRSSGNDDARESKQLKPGQVPDYQGPALELDEEAVQSALESISNWKLEAKLEDVARYFVAFPEVDEVKSGVSAYIIGRKGTGKTAIVSHFMETQEEGFSFEKLTFKNFPFNELYALDNSEYTRPNQYISIWTYIIYSTILNMMADSESVDHSVRKKIRKIYPEKNHEDLKGLLKKWTSGDFSISILGTGFSVSNWFRSSETTSWLERVDHLRDFITNNCDDKTYVVMFDELDEDYKEMITQQVSGEYIQLLTSLFKATQEVRSNMDRAGKKIFPVVFLRDDIYDLITDSDKNKWRDFSAFLEWSPNDIKKLLKHRIDSAARVSGGSFEETWYSIFTRQSISYAAGRKSAPSFDYISRSTQGRPRDYIHYLQVCAESQLRSGVRVIGQEVIIDADKSYSNYLKSELIDEIHGVIPDINNIFRIFTHVRKWIMSIDEFRKIFEDYLKRDVISTRDPDFVLQTLFYFSVIGNVSRNGAHIFRHERPESVLNFHENIVIHRGLMKSLQII